MSTIEILKKAGKNQTIDMCMTAVKEDGIALKYVKKQTPEICMAAVKQNGLALQYVKDKTPEICREAIANNPEAEKYDETGNQYLRMTGIMKMLKPF